MLRRGIVSYLIALLLLPGACAAHSHAEASAHDSSGRYRPPHFHLRLIVPWPQEQPDSRVFSSDSSNDGFRVRPLADHDADAIYLADSNFSGWNSDPLSASEHSSAAMITLIVGLPDTPFIAIPTERVPPSAPIPPPAFLVSVSLLI